MTKTEMIYTALDNLRKNAGIEGEWKDNARNKGKDKGTDGTIKLKVDNKPYKIYAEVKKTIRHHQLAQIKETARAHHPLLLVAGHIFPGIKEQLRHEGIAYLEANGNIYLKEQGIYLWIDNQKPLPPEKEKTARTFTKTGLRVIFQFLLREETVNYPYRDIARMAGVGLGNINYVMTGLKQGGYLLKTNKNKHTLVNKKSLLDKWMAGYDERLKPALLAGTYRFVKDEDEHNWKKLPLEQHKTCWGAEPAADLLTNYLRPATYTLYTTENRAALIKHYRLIPDAEGKIKVYEKFWNDEDGKELTAPALLVYADLMNTGDSRCMETAKKIYDDRLAGKF